MNDYRIVTESTADLTVELAERFDISIIPMRFCVGEREYVNDPDNRELSPEEFYDMLSKGETSTTSAVNMAEFEEFFTPILEAGSDILYLAFSSALSSTYSTALIAAETLRTRFPQRKIAVVDTLCASMGEGLMVCKAAMLKKQGMDIDEVADWVEKNRLKLAQWFTVDDLMHLYRGGRVSAVSAHVGTALGIKPLLHVDDEGRLIPKNKIRGRRHAIDAMAKKMKELASGVPQELVLVNHGNCPEDAQYLAETVRWEFPSAEVYIGDVGPVIGSHAGPGVLTLFFFGNGRG